MKKIITAIVFVIASAGVVSAQDAGKKEAIRKQLKTEFKLTEFEADSLLSVQSIFEVKSKKVKSNPALSLAQKKEKLDEELWMRRERMKILVREIEIDKVQAFYDKISGQ